MHQTKKISLFIIFLSFSAGTPLSMAKLLPDTSPSTQKVMTTLNNNTLVNFLHYVNQGEIVEANSALQRSTTPEVRSFAQTMLDDHQEGDGQVNQLATQKGLALFDYQPSTVDIATDAQLQNLSDSDFDHAYLNLMLMDHQKALQDLKLLQSQINDPDLQTIINQTIPVIQKHIDLAKAALNP